jgi:hypothetical protein
MVDRPEAYLEKLEDRPEALGRGRLVDLMVASDLDQMVGLMVASDPDLMVGRLEVFRQALDRVRLEDRPEA